MSKAVTVAEITKRRLRGLHQNTQIGLAPAATAATSAGASASKHPQPDISIVLSLAPLDTSQPGYQPPLTDEEILNACVDDEQEQDCGDAAASDAATAAAPARPPAGASSSASSGAAGTSAVHAGKVAVGEAAAGRVATGTATAAAAAAAAAAGGDDARAVVFLDIDGVLLPFGEGAPACVADSDPARCFPRDCLAALARLLEARSPPQPAP